MRLVIALLFVVGCSTAAPPTAEPLFRSSSWSYPLHVDLVVAEPLTIFDLDEGERPAPELREFLDEGLQFAHRTLTFAALKHVADRHAVAFTVTHPELRLDSIGRPQVILAVSAFIPGLPEAEVTIPSKIHQVGSHTVTELQNQLVIEKIDEQWRVAGWVF